MLALHRTFDGPVANAGVQKGVDGREPELTLGGPSLGQSRKCLLEAKLALRCYFEVMRGPPLLHTKGDDSDAGEQTCSGAAGVGARV